MSTLSQKGFTIVELMVVILVLAALSVLAGPGLFDALNKNKVIASTNQLIGLLEFARNTAKSTNKGVVVSKCDASEDCGIKVVLLESRTSTTIPPLRVIHKSDTANVTPPTKDTVFYPDGTRGLHITNTSINVFNDNGSFTTKTSSFDVDESKTNSVWQIKAGSYCRVITVTKLGTVKVATEGCS